MFVVNGGVYICGEWMMVYIIANTCVRVEDGDVLDDGCILLCMRRLAVSC